MVYLGSVLFFMFLCFITLESSISDPKTILYFSHLSGTCFHVLRLCLHDNFAFVKREKKKKEKEKKKKKKKKKKKVKRKKKKKKKKRGDSTIDNRSAQRYNSPPPSQSIQRGQAGEGVTGDAGDGIG